MKIGHPPDMVGAVLLLPFFPPWEQPPGRDHQYVETGGLSHASAMRLVFTLGMRRKKARSRQGRAWCVKESF